MKKVQSSPDSSKFPTSLEASAAPSHPHQDDVNPAGAASPSPAPAPSPSQHRSPAQPPGGSGPQIPPDPPTESNEPLSERPDTSRPVLAFRSDFTALLSVEELGDRDLKGRTLWTGIVLTPKEMQTLRSRANNTEHEAAARVIAGLPKRDKPGGN